MVVPMGSYNAPFGFGSAYDGGFGTNSAYTSPYSFSMAWGTGYPPGNMGASYSPAGGYYNPTAGGGIYNNSFSGMSNPYASQYGSPYNTQNYSPYTFGYFGGIMPPSTNSSPYGNQFTFQNTNNYDALNAFLSTPSSMGIGLGDNPVSNYLFGGGIGSSDSLSSLSSYTPNTTTAPATSATPGTVNTDILKYKPATVDYGDCSWDYSPSGDIRYGNIMGSLDDLMNSGPFPSTVDYGDCSWDYSTQGDIRYNNIMSGLDNLFK